MILALETSSSLCAVCVFDETRGETLVEISNDIGRGHAERLMDDVASALSQAGVCYRSLSSIACGTGPGSFTGIRVGVAAARGFGLALAIPVHGITSLQAIALQAKQEVSGKSLLAVQDAGRGELYVQWFDAHARPLGAPDAVTLDALAPAKLNARLRGAPFFVCGSGAHVLAGLDGIELCRAHSAATAVSVARASLDPAMRASPKPLYLRAPDAKPQGGFAIARTGF